MSTKHFLQPIKPIGVICHCCNAAEQHLAMDTVLHNMIGGWSITKDGKPFFQEDMDTDYNDAKKLQWIEDQARLEPDADWRASIEMALHGETYQRQGDKWVLVEQTKGYA